MTRIYLLFSAFALFPIALSYGVDPATVLPKLLDLKVEGTDLVHIFRAVMGLYLGMIVLWVGGAFRPSLAKAAVISEIVFMLGLAFGRLLSLVIDGMPSRLLILYLIAELFMGFWGLVVLKGLSSTSEGS
jgi:Domain of unknown function (DUF4345)